MKCSLTILTVCLVALATAVPSNASNRGPSHFQPNINWGGNAAQRSNFPQNGGLRYTEGSSYRAPNSTWTHRDPNGTVRQELPFGIQSYH